MRYYVLGSTGYMGSRLVEYLQSKGHEVITQRLDVSSYPLLKGWFKMYEPDVAVNLTGAKAYPTIDWCEDNKLETVKVNVAGPINFAMAAIDNGVYPIQISSGCIYTGGPETPFTEEDPPNFFGSFYSRMRVVMQDALKELPVLQLRIRMPISMYSHPRNFINKIISYKKVISIPNSVTLIEDMFPAIELLAEKRPVGVLNLTNDGYITHKAVLEAYERFVDPSHSYEEITLDQLVGGITKAKRSNCVLDNTKARSLGVEMPELDLEKVMTTFKSSLH